MDVILELAEKYADSITTPEDALLKKINEETYSTHVDPQMLSGHVQGKLLEFISTLLRPKYILEIGTFVGYSAICLAKGLQPEGELHTIELRQADADLSLKNFKLAGMHKKIHLHIGNAVEIIPVLPFQWDLVFIDADKPGYIIYYDLAIDRLSKNGLIIADNVLFHGQVLEDPIKGKNALAIDAFNKRVASDERTEQVMLTVRDGLLFIKKKS
jgi:caffeoyl-CoA O-methyltransferase